MISYQLKFTEEEDGQIQGTSVTDFSGDHRTESTITGNIDRDENTISFNEVNNASTMSDFPDDSFCFIHLKNAKIKLKKKKSIIQGHFWSYFADGSDCIDGDIYLISEDYYFNKVEKMTKRAKFLTGNKNLQATDMIIQKTKENSDQITLQNNESIKFTTSLDYVTIIIEDPEYEDGDIVRILVNDEILAPSIKVMKTPKVYKIPLDSSENKVTISALNEGKIPPNSAKVTIKELESDIPLVIRLNEGNDVNFIFNKDSEE